MGLAGTSVFDVIKFKTYEWDFTRKVQGIRKLRITPQPTAVLFSFRTVQPTVPVIEIFRNITGDAKIDMKPENLVANAFNFIDAMLGNVFTTHKVRMTGLAQGSRFHFRITATDGSHRSAVTVGTFATCSRNVSVFIRDVMIWNDGDPGLKASGELDFDFGFYFDNSKMAEREYRGNISSGEVRDFPFGKGATLVTGAVPDRFTVFVRGAEYDNYGWPIDGFDKKWSPPFTLPETLAAFENGEATVAEAMQSFDMPQAPGSYSQTLALKSGPHGIHFWINGRIDIEVVPPSEPPFVPLNPLLEFEYVNVASIAGLGSKTGMKKSGKLHGFAIGPENSLYMKRPDAPQWEKVDDSAPAAAEGCACDLSAAFAIDGQDRLHVLTLRAGTLRHAAMSARGRAEPLRFRLLGEGIAKDPTIVSAEDGAAYVLARDGEGALRAAALTGAERGRWIELGGSFAGPVSAHAQRREIEIFGVDPEGRPVVGTWRIGSRRGPEWMALGQGLGRMRLRFLDVMVERSRAHLIALAEDRRLFVLTRSGDSWSGAWKDYGSLDSFGFEKPKAEAVRASAARKANGAARPTPARRGKGRAEGARASA